MPGLQDLPARVLDRLVWLLQPLEDWSTKLGERIRKPHGYLPSPDVVALASTCKTVRKSLEPHLFGTLILSEPAPMEKEKVQWLLQKGRKQLEMARILLLGELRADAFDTARECIKLMVNLETVGYCGSSPLSPQFVEVLATLPRFSGFQCFTGGVESLPHLLPLADKLTHLIIATDIYPPHYPEVWDLCPITVAAERRNQLPHDSKNVPTLREQAEATVNGLADLLLAAKDNLKVLGVSGRGIHKTLFGATRDPFALAWLSHLFQRMRELNDGEYPLFPELEGLRISHCDAKCVGMTHLLKTSTKIKELEIAGRQGATMPVVKDSLKKLEWLYILADDLVKVAPFVRRVTAESALRFLTINGIQQNEVASVFENDLPNLRELRLTCYGTTPFELRYFQRIVKRCPLLVTFDLTGQFYDCEAIFDALRPLPHLRRFAFDHPWEKPRNFPWPSPDGRTIRTNRHQDFRVMSVVSGSINAEMRRRIREDLDAVTPVYHKRFASIAKKHPSLRDIVWTATDEVTWEWTFVRDGDLDTGKLKKLQHHPEIGIEVGGPGDSVPAAAGVFLTMPVMGAGLM